MDARAKTIREILHSGDQYLVPFFQRQYSWVRKHWVRLFSDLVLLVEDGPSSSEHFLGPLVCTPTDHVPGEVPAYQLIDGQQRLTTLTILLCALREVAREHKLDELGDEITEDYLVHKRKKGLQRYKVVPRLGDRASLLALIDEQIKPEPLSVGVYQARDFFYQQISEWVYGTAETRIRELFVAMTERLSLVVITIDGENPYEIFESLNSTGLPLEESDLVRNYLFMQVPIAEQEEFNSDHWEDFEQIFETIEDYPAITPTAFYRNFLMRLGEYSKAKQTFVDKKQNRQRGLTPVEQVAELKRFAGFEQSLRRPKTCQDPGIRNALEQLAMLDITTAHPLLLNLFERHINRQLDYDEFRGCLHDLASFALRRSICGESTRNYGRWFCEAITAIREDPKSD